MTNNAQRPAAWGSLRRPGTDADRFRILWPAVAITGLLLIAMALWLRGLERPSEWAIPSEEIRPMLGQAWMVDLKDRLTSPWHLRGDDLWDHVRSDLRLFEDGRMLGQPHTLTARIEQQGAGRYAHWGRLLIFSTPDGSDPRHNGRHYRLTATAQVRYEHLRGLGIIGGLLFLAGSLGAMINARGGIARSLTFRFRPEWQRAGDWLLAGLIPALSAGLLLTQIPPIWNNSDSVLWLSSQLTWIPHHPPGYPLLMGLLH